MAALGDVQSIRGRVVLQGGFVISHQQRGVDGCVRREGGVSDSLDKIARMTMGERSVIGSEIFCDHGCGRGKKGGNMVGRLYILWVPFKPRGRTSFS